MSGPQWGACLMSRPGRTSRKACEAGVYRLPPQERERIEGMCHADLLPIRTA